MSKRLHIDSSFSTLHLLSMDVELLKDHSKAISERIYQKEKKMAMLQSVEAGKFKVFSTLSDWFEEFRMYHRQDNKVVPIRDDLMSATRYAFQSQRFAVAGEDPTWTEDLKYRNYGII